MLLASAVPPRSVSATDLPPLRPGNPPLFTSDVAISLDSEGRPALSVSLSVPYPELQWLKLPSGFAAGAEFAIVFEPDRRGRVYGDVWERRVVAPSFAVTLAPGTALTDKRSFDVPPGRYSVRVSVRDLNGQLQSTAHGRLEVPDYSKVPMGFADLELGVVDSTGAFRPVPTRQFGFDVSHLAARATLFDRRSGSWPRNYTFRYRLLDDLGEALQTGTRELELARSAEPVVVRPDRSDLFVGGYVFEIELTEGRSHWRVERSFEVEESGPPRGREFEHMLEALSYIAESREVDYLRSLSPDEQPRGWEEFWRRRDPTPDTPRNEAMLEFLRRVRYTERHFQGFGPGWRSDMGRIYIKYGPPDQIENRPANTQSRPLEIWTYNQPFRRFLFEDREGFGRYVLIGPSLE